MAKFPEELKAMSRKFAAKSIVTEALARLIQQIFMEIHETYIRPRDELIKEMYDRMQVPDLATQSEFREKMQRMGIWV